jgi:hypothetical protein
MNNISRRQTHRSLKLITIILITYSHFSFGVDPWPYLNTEVFKTRSVIAAYILRDCLEIIEIGGYKTPLSDFIPNKKITVIDPKVIPKQTSLVQCLAISFKDWIGNATEQKYGVCILGLRLLDMNDQAWKKLYALINNAYRVVIEVPITYPPSTQQWNQMLPHINKKIIMQILLDLDNNNFKYVMPTHPNYHPDYCKRLIYVLG